MVVHPFVCMLTCISTVFKISFFKILVKDDNSHINDSRCVKSALIRSYSGQHFPAFGLNTERILRISPDLVRMRQNADQNNSEYGHFLRSVIVRGYELWI